MTNVGDRAYTAGVENAQTIPKYIISEKIFWGLRDYTY